MKNEWKIVEASPFEISLIKNGEGIRTWWKSTPPLEILQDMLNIIFNDVLSQKLLKEVLKQ